MPAPEIISRLSYAGAVALRLAVAGIERLHAVDENQ